jgi:hypothetical protein
MVWDVLNKAELVSNRGAVVYTGKEKTIKGVRITPGCQVKVCRRRIEIDGMPIPKMVRIHYAPDRCNCTREVYDAALDPACTVM